MASWGGGLVSLFIVLNNAFGLLLDLLIVAETKLERAEMRADLYILR